MNGQRKDIYEGIVIRIACRTDPDQSAHDAWTATAYWDCPGQVQAERGGGPSGDEPMTAVTWGGAERRGKPASTPQKALDNVLASVGEQFLCEHQRFEIRKAAAAEREGGPK